MANRSAADMSRGTRPSGIENTKLYLLVRNGLRVPVEVESQEREVISRWSTGCVADSRRAKRDTQG